MNVPLVKILAIETHQVASVMMDITKMTRKNVKVVMTYVLLVIIILPVKLARTEEI